MAIGAPKHVLEHLKHKYATPECPKRARIVVQPSTPRTGEIKWTETDETSWQPCMLKDMQLVERHIHTATIVYDKGVLLPSEESLLNNKKVLLVERHGMSYIVWASETFHHRFNINYLGNCVFPSRRGDIPISDVWELQPPNDCPDIMGRPPSAQRRCLYILDVTKLVPIHYDQLTNSSKMTMMFWSWKDTVSKDRDTITADGSSFVIEATTVNQT